MSKWIVIKCGGSTLEKLTESFFRDILALQEGGYHPVLVHGGGPSINAMLDRLGVETRFHDGLRVTDAQTLEVVEMVLAGTTNKRLVTALTSVGARAVGISGVDDRLVQAEVANPALGLVGEVQGARVDVLQTLAGAGFIPVVATLGVSASGQHLNVNGDTTAAALARELSAQRLVLVTDVDGVYLTREGERRIAERLTPAQVAAHIADGQISGGMIPKVRGALECLEAGVREVVICNGAHPGVLTGFLRGQQVGTTFVQEGE